MCPSFPPLLTPGKLGTIVESGLLETPFSIPAGFEDA